MLKWIGHKSVRRGGKLREPIIGESFAGIDEVADSLLREAVQNSLDAISDRGKPVRVRIYVSGESGALDTDEASRWFQDAWPHFKADPVLKQKAAPERCPFVVVEDFNTTGLSGDIHEAHSLPESPNPWCLFFRKEGQSQKSAEDRGRWGVGKVVFPLSSAVHAFIGATVRKDDAKRYVMGQAMLRSRIVDGEHYDPDLWFCQMERDGFELPSDDPRLFRDLEKTFKLRRAEEPGLSVVIPYSDKDIDRDSLARAALREFFYPILSGILEMEIEADGCPPLTLTASSLLEHAKVFLADRHPDALHQVEMAHWLLTSEPARPMTSLPKGPFALRWSPDLLDDSIALSMRSALGQGEHVVLRIATRVIHQNGQPDERTHFDLVLKRAEDTALHRPAYVRSGLVIPEVKGTQVRGYHALVVCTDAPICTMLGDAENPAHTDWVKNSSNFKGKYKYAPSQLDYVRQAPSNVCGVLAQSDTPIHRTALIDIFYVSDDDGQRGQGGPTNTPGQRTPPRAHPKPVSRPQPFTIREVAGGVVISSTDTPLAPDKLLEVALAYDVFSGDPINKFSPLDFRLKDLQRSIDGIVVDSMQDNKLLLRNADPDFRIEILGFDANRDLVVKVRERDLLS